MLETIGIVVHLDEAPDPRRRSRIESGLRREEGVIWARFIEADPHLMRVEYDPARITPTAICRQLFDRERLHAEPLVGTLPQDICQ